MKNVVMNVRLPRIALALLAGAGLSSAGAAFQALFANPLATPDTLGVATGASFGAVLAILSGWPSLAIQTNALLFGILAVALVYLVSLPKKGGGRASVVMIVLAGMVVGSLFSALVSLVKYAADPQDVLPAITFWLMGSLSSTTKETLVLERLLFWRNGGSVSAALEAERDDADGRGGGFAGNSGEEDPGCGGDCGGNDYGLRGIHVRTDRLGGTVDSPYLPDAVWKQ